MGLGGHSNTFGAQARAEKKRVSKEWAGGEAMERYTVIGPPFCTRYISLSILNQCRTLFFQFSEITDKMRHVIALAGQI